MTLFTTTASWVTDEHRMFAEMADLFMEDELVPNIDRWIGQFDGEPKEEGHWTGS